MIFLKIIIVFLFTFFHRLILEAFFCLFRKYEHFYFCLFIKHTEKRFLNITRERVRVAFPGRVFIAFSLKQRNDVRDFRFDVV